MADDDDMRVEFMGPSPDGSGMQVYHSFEEMANAMDEHRKAHQGENEAKSHEMERFIMGLSEWEAKQVMQLVLMASINQYMANRLVGRLEQLLAERHNICGACDKNHDHELAKMAENAMKQMTQEAAKPKPIHDESAPVFKTNAQLMDEYRLEANPEGDTLVRCRDCKTSYQSLNDRMLKRPSECDGCAQKAKWG